MVQRHVVFVGVGVTAAAAAGVVVAPAGTDDVACVGVAIAAFVAVVLMPSTNSGRQFL